MKQTYNQRLYGSKISRFLHESRFLWVKKMLNKHNGNHRFRIIELGCLDARILNYLPVQSIDYYYGIDAGWDGYTESAIQKYKDFNNLKFMISTNVEDISTVKKVDAAIAMQVFEYIPADHYHAYFNKFSEIGCTDLYITISNERGLFMVLKLLIKRLLRKNVSSYSLKEIWALITGNMDRIERTDGLMKGFDYKLLIKKINDIYDIEKIVGLPFPRIPLALNFTIAIHAKQKAF